MTIASSTGIDWTVIDAVIFDVDGTLFDNVPLRRRMAVRLLGHLLTSRSGWSDVRTLMKFRRTRERLASAGADNIGQRQILDVAAAIGFSSDQVNAIVTRWIYREPLAYIPRYAMPDAASFISKLRNRGIRTGVFSDYPACDKLTVLGIEAEVVCDASAPEIGRLKPHPGGFIRVAELLGVSPHRCLIIGDRDDRDGEAARRAGFKFLRKIHAAEQLQPYEFCRYEQLIREIELVKS